MGTRIRSGADLAAGIAGGVVATVTMDAAMVLAARLAPETFASDKNSPEMIGRWAAGLVPRPRAARGHLGRDAGARRAVDRARRALRDRHHADAVYLEAARRSGRRPGVAGATAYGVATGVLPLLLMYPSMGYGCCGRRSGDARRIVCSMLLGHAAFGAGIGLWAATRRRG